MKFWIATLSSAALLAGLHAQADESVQIVTRPGPGVVVAVAADEAGQAEQLYTIHRDRVNLVRHHRVVEPAAVISRELAEQPVYPHLAQLRMDHTIIYVDPNYDYRAKRPGRLDEGHSILRAQRLYHALNRKPVEIVTNPRGHEAMHERTPTPRAIFLRPEATPRPDKHQSPRVLHKSDARPMARAD